MGEENGTQVSTEVKTPTKRRYLNRSFKEEVLNRISHLKGSGQVGAYLREKGLYYSSIQQWRKELSEEKKTGKKEKSQAALLKQEIESLKRRNATLEKKLKQSQTIIEVQKKISQILENENE